jgi:hypothetical protein
MSLLVRIRKTPDTTALPLVSTFTVPWVPHVHYPKHPLADISHNLLVLWRAMHLNRQNDGIRVVGGLRKRCISDCLDDVAKIDDGAKGVTMRNLRFLRAISRIPTVKLDAPAVQDSGFRIQKLGFRV